MYKQDEHSSNEMSDFQSLSKKVTEEINDALSHNGASLSYFASSPTKESEKKNYKNMADV